MMAKRDPKKTARNEEVATITQQLNDLQSCILHLTGCSSVHQLNAKIGGKYQDFINVKERCIRTSEEYLSLYLDGLVRHIKAKPPATRRESALYQLATWYQDHENFRTYMDLFVRRSFLNHFDALTRIKPTDRDARLWIGANNADYGLLVTPRFNTELCEWENDKSEIRRFRPEYFTIGHILETGLVIPGKNRTQKFPNLENYLGFFQDTLVRNAGSKHQDDVAERYAEFVRTSPVASAVPLLIPELRYRGRDKKHKYRLDFCVIDPYSLKKVGFELSPWSSHGRLTRTKSKSVKTVNDEALANAEREARKRNAYFEKKGISIIDFLDEALADPDALFNRIVPYLKPEKRPVQLLLHSRTQLLEMDLDAEVENVWDEDDV